MVKIKRIFWGKSDFNDYWICSSTIFYCPLHIIKLKNYETQSIFEVAEQVKNLRSIPFKLFGSKLVDNIPTYEYKLEDGISHERPGMYILKNEKIIEILDSMTNKKGQPVTKN